jgi:hypothetical protein
MDLPSPQPGHQLKPKLSKGHKLECEDPEAVNAKNKIALIQIINSNGKLNINR